MASNKNLTATSLARKPYQNLTNTLPTPTIVGLDKVLVRFW